MSDTNAPITKIAARTFNDAGTLRRFERGKPVDATPGELANYEAAGLLLDPNDADGMLAEIAAVEGAAETSARTKRSR